MSDYAKERSLEDTPTWAVAVVVFVMLAVSILIEHLLHIVEKWLEKKHRPALIEALEKVKAELMLLGFISLLLTILQDYISRICVSKKIADTWHPCAPDSNESKESTGRRLLQLMSSSAEADVIRRSLASAKGDKCASQGKVAFVSAYGIHQLHIFIFVLAITHILYCILTYILGKTKMRRWKTWEDETKTIEYQYHNDPERFRFARDTSFGRRHLKLWSRSPILLWVVSFFRQFIGSVNKVDYFTLRHGFIMAHLAPGSESSFDFQKYINRSLEEDFKVVVGITPVIWFIAVLFLLTNTYGWFAYLWLPFIPLIIILLVGAKLQMIITEMGLRIQEKGDVVKGAPIVQPGDELFWFGRPRLLLFLIHVVLFQNAFQLAFFAWTVYSFNIDSCFHSRAEDIAIRITMGVIIQVLCSYVTLPLYALVTQMGSTMKPTIFNDRVATALKSWHHTAKKHRRHGQNSESHTLMSSRPGTPSYGMSPVHLLHNYRSSTAPNSSHASPRNSNFDNDHWDPEALTSTHGYDADDFHHSESPEAEQQNTMMQNQNPVQPPATIHSESQSSSSMTEFTFRKD